MSSCDGPSTTLPVAARRALTSRRRCWRFVDDPATHHRHHRSDVLDLVSGNSQVVAIDHDEVRQLAWLNRSDVALLHDRERAPLRVSDEGMLAADRLPVDHGATDHLARNREVKRREGTILVHFEGVGPEAPGHAALLNRPERGHVVRAVAVHTVEDCTHDGGAWLNRRVYAQLAHALQVRCRQLLAVNERPSEVPHRKLLVDPLDLVEESIEGILQR